MKKILITIIGLVLICGILTFSIIKLINTEVALYKNISTNEIQKMIENDESFIVYMYQKSCPSCEKIRPIINEYIRNSNNEIFAVDINSDENKNYLLQDLNIQGTPTVIFYSNGNETGRFTSVFTKEEFEKKVENNGMHILN